MNIFRKFLIFPIIVFTNCFSLAKDANKRLLTGEDFLAALANQELVLAKNCPGANADSKKLLEFIKRTGENIFSTEEPCKTMDEGGAKIDRCEYYVSDKPLDKMGTQWTITFDYKISDKISIENLICKKEDFLATDEEAVETSDQVSSPFKGLINVESCMRALKLPEFKDAPTAIRRGLNIEASACFSRSMNLALDKRLVPLKKSNPNQFKREMNLQKVFLKSIDKYCSRWETYYSKCCSSCSMNEVTDCQIDFYKWRSDQIPKDPNNIGQKKWGVTADAFANSAFVEFAKGYCEINESKNIENCSANIISELTEAVHLHKPKEKCE